MTLWKYDLLDEIKREFFQAVAVSVRMNSRTTWTLAKYFEKMQDSN